MNHQKFTLLRYASYLPTSVLQRWSDMFFHVNNVRGRKCRVALIVAMQTVNSTTIAKTAPITSRDKYLLYFPGNTFTPPSAILYEIGTVTAHHSCCGPLISHVDAEEESVYSYRDLGHSPQCRSLLQMSSFSSISWSSIESLHFGWVMPGMQSSQDDGCYLHPDYG